MINDLPNDLKREIFRLVDERSNLDAVSKVSKDFRRLSVETVSESMKIGLWYYKKHGSAYDQAELAATLSTGDPKLKQVNQLLRVSLIAYREDRLVESFARWRHDWTETDHVSFFGELNKLSRARKRLVPTRDEQSVQHMWGAKTKADFDKVKAKGHYRPRLLMDLIVRFAYTRVMDETAITRSSPRRTAP